MNEKFYQYSDPDRIKAVIDTLAAVTEPERPFTRLVFSDEYKEARTWLQSQAAIEVTTPVRHTYFDLFYFARF